MENLIADVFKIDCLNIYYPRFVVIGSVHPICQSYSLVQDLVDYTFKDIYNSSLSALLRAGLHQ